MAKDLSGKVVEHVSSSLRKLANPSKAREMAAYMKTTMPFYGVQKPDRVPILRELKKNFRPENRKEYKDCVLALWMQPHREEKYFAINYAYAFPEFVVRASMPLYEQLVRQGAWWDLVDTISADLVGHVYLHERDETSSIIEKWSSDRDLWIRRASLICHLHHKSETDMEQLFRFCLKMADEKEFFIQKGMGWALREYSKSNPKAVKSFLRKHSSLLSPLTLREGSKHLNRLSAQ